MAIYEFGCGSCKDVVEKMQSYDDPPPTCCSKEMARLMSVVCFDLRGSGFHQNDYGNGAHKLSTKDQAQRASVDCGNLGLVSANPNRGPQPSERQIDKMRERAS